MQTAQIDWKTDNFGNVVPTSSAFDDVYFSHAHGLSESLYVFGEQNHLAERFEICFKTCQNFTIAETGFGTGLNFLMACKLWANVAKRYDSTPRLHFISTEKFPLRLDDLTKSLSVWQDDEILSLFINELINNYPLPLMGCHRRYFSHNIMLDLWLGDAQDGFQTLEKQNNFTKNATKNNTTKIDAWFLDGFAPKKNSELWSPAIFDSLAHLSKPSTTLATFTSAGDVKRELIRIGATPKKVKGFGKKREMLTATFENLPSHEHHPTPKTALVVGCGVAGLMTAYALASRGVAVTIIDKTAPIAGASGNPKALFSPKLTDISGVADNLSLISFLYARHLYCKFNQLSEQEIFSQTGVIDFLLPTQKTNEKLSALVAQYPDELIADYDNNSDFGDEFNAKYKSFLPMAGLIDTKKLAEFVLQNPDIRFQQGEIYNLATPQFDGITYDVAVISAGFESHLVNDTIFNCRKIRGQVSWLKNLEITNHFNHLNASIKYDGYACGFDDTLLFGASFVRNDSNSDIRPDEHAFNWEKLHSALPDLANNIKINDLQGRASIRGQTPDYHPIVGQIADGVFVNTAYGSKGFSFAPLCGEIVAGLIFGEILPVSDTLLAKLNPQRTRLQTPIDESR